MWLTEFREANGLSIEQLGRAVRMAGKRKEPQIYIRDTTLLNLEREPGYLVIPAFADLIAEVCGATPEQRDALTLPRYAGRWRPTGAPADEMTRRTPAKRESDTEAAKVEREAAEVEQNTAKMEQKAPNVSKKTREAAFTNVPGADENRGRAVVALNTDGQVVGTYRGPSHAAIGCGISGDMVLRRCYRKMKGNEFSGIGHTFRFRDEWEAMSEAERRADMNRAGCQRIAAPAPVPSPAVATAQPSYRPNAPRPVVTVDVYGKELGRYRCIAAAAKAHGVKKTLAYQHCTLRGGYATHFIRSGVGFYYAAEWDGMDTGQRAAHTIARGSDGKLKRGHHRRAVVVIDAEGHELGRYRSGVEAAEATGEKYDTMMSRVGMIRGYSSHYTRKGMGYFYAEEWDEMSEEAKAAATPRPHTD